MNTQPPARQRKKGIGAGASRQPPKTEYIYHWNRILAALVGLLLLFGLIGFAVYAWLSPPATRDNAGMDAGVPPGAQVEAEPEPRAREVDATEIEPAEPEAAQAPDAPMAPDDEVPTEEEALVPPDGIDTVGEQPSQVFLPPDTRVNLRAEPSLTSTVLLILDASAELQLLSMDESFYEVRTAEGVVGWVSREFSSLSPYSEPPG
jgi:hypothetical protein